MLVWMKISSNSSVNDQSLISVSIRSPLNQSPGRTSLGWQPSPKTRIARAPINWIQVGIEKWIFFEVLMRIWKFSLRENESPSSHASGCSTISRPISADTPPRITDPAAPKLRIAPARFSGVG